MKAQTSLEMILIAIVVISVATLSFTIYSGEGDALSIEATLRSLVDSKLASATLDFPGCADTRLVEIRHSNNNYIIVTTNTACGRKIFSGDVLKDFWGKISVSLGCNYLNFNNEVTLYCKGKDYNLQVL